MNLKKCIFTENECYIRGDKITPIGFMLHSTGANNPNLRRYVQPNDGLLGENAYNNHWNQFRPSGRQVCVHGFIGKLLDGTIATYQTLPWDYKGWHCGGNGNKGYIGVEICEDNLSDSNYFMQVYNEAVELVANLAKMYGWDINENTVLCHSEGYKKGIASNHSDVMHWFPKFGKSMDTFREDVKRKLNEDNIVIPNPTPQEPEESYLVRVTANALNVRNGAGTGYKINTCIRDRGVYTIVETQNNWGKLKSGAGWICLDYTEKLDNSVIDNSTKDIFNINVGDKVKVQNGARTYTGGGLASFVYSNVYDVIEINGDRIVIGKGNIVTAAININNLIKI